MNHAFSFEGGMGQLAAIMPVVVIDPTELKKWGEKWLNNKKEAETEAQNKFSAKEETRKKKAHTAGRKFKAKVFDPSSVSGAFARDESVQFATMFDRAFGNALAKFLGNVPVVPPNGDSLLPPQEDCVEVGAAKIVGGIRPQNYDAAYRPDGPRVVLDSKSLNDRKSIGKNWQNMINDLATEAATIHTRFPYAGFRANCLVRDGISAVQRCFHLALNDAHRRSASAGGSYRFLSSHAYIY